MIGWSRSCGSGSSRDGGGLLCGTSPAHRCFSFDLVAEYFHDGRDRRDLSLYRKRQNQKFQLTAKVAAVKLVAASSIEKTRRGQEGGREDDFKMTTQTFLSRVQNAWGIVLLRNGEQTRCTAATDGHEFVELCFGVLTA
jgi:hypothetical protein